MRSLVDLYELTLGAQWRTNSGWLSGDPCTGGWHGVTCIGPTEEGHAIGELRLSDNGLGGRLAGWSSVTALQALSVLDVESNGLDGQLPTALSQMPEPVELHLDGNNFDFIEESYNELFRACRAARCSGLPPESCKAFGTTWRPSFDNANECVPCENAQFAFACAIGGGLLVLIAAAAYVTVLLKFPVAFERWGGTITLVLTHVQTLSILGSLAVDWPQSTRFAFSGLDLLVGDMASLRAECLVGGRPSSSMSMYHLKALASMGFLLLLPVVFIVLRLYHRFRHHEKRSDNIFFISSVCYQMTFLATVHAILKVMLLHHDVAVGKSGSLTDVSSMNTVLVLLAMTLFACHASVLTEAYFNVQELRWLRREKVIASQRKHNGANAVPDLHVAHPFRDKTLGRCISCLVPTSEERLERRLRFVTKRFAKHAPRWQFVVSARQLSLTLIASVGSALRERLGSSSKVNVMRVQCASSVLVFLCSFVATWMFKPYAHQYQNQIEKLCLVCSALTIILGSVYTTLEDPVIALEAGMLILIVGSTLLGIFYAIVAVRRERVLTPPTEALKEIALDRLTAARITVLTVRQSISPTEERAFRLTAAREKARTKMESKWCEPLDEPFESLDRMSAVAEDEEVEVADSSSRRPQPKSKCRWSRASVQPRDLSEATMSDVSRLSHEQRLQVRKRDLNAGSTEQDLVSEKEHAGRRMRKSSKHAACRSFEGSRGNCSTLLAGVSCSDAPVAGDETNKGAHTSSSESIGSHSIGDGHTGTLHDKSDGKHIKERGACHQVNQPVRRGSSKSEVREMIDEDRRSNANKEAPPRVSGHGQRPKSVNALARATQVAAVAAHVDKPAEEREAHTHGDHHQSHQVHSHHGHGHGHRHFHASHEEDDAHGAIVVHPDHSRNAHHSHRAHHAHGSSS